MEQLARASSIATLVVVSIVNGRTALSSPQLAPPTTANAQLGSLPSQVSAACQPSWVPTFGATSGTLTAVIVFDDGSAPELYAGGYFMPGGGATPYFAAKWSGKSWIALGSGFDGYVGAFGVFDDGGGPALYAAGGFTTAGGVPANHIAKWNGSNWSALGSGIDGSIYALEVFDDGSGPALFASGHFTTAGGAPARNIAKWNGSTWSALGSGLGSTTYNGAFALAVYDDGGGPALYAAGSVSDAGGAPTNGIAKWDGSNWSALGSGLTSTTNAVVRALTVFDDGSGPALYVGGYFSNAGGATANNIARWDGSLWSTLGSGLNNGMTGLIAFDDGSGTKLYAAGSFTAAGGSPANRVARWNGTSWSELGNGLGAPVIQAYVMTGFDDGHGPMLYVGATFNPVGGYPLNAVWTWNGTTWSTPTNGLDNTVQGLTVFDDGHGPALYACGEFTMAGAVTTNRVGRWNGSTWSVLGSGLPFTASTVPFVYALASFDDGTGPGLYVGGQFITYVPLGVVGKNIGKWNGSSWSLLGTGTGGDVRALTVFDDGSGPALYAGGRFGDAGGVTVWSIAKWDGSNWSSLGIGMTPNSTVWALTVFDDGSGPALYVGGSFTSAGNVGANHVAKWNGFNWSALGSGVDDEVRALAVFDDGSGPALYAGGLFANAGGSPAKHTAKWNGSYWSALGIGVNGEVDALTAFDDGNGPALYVGGAFTTAGAVAANHIAKWNGTSWSAVGNGANNAVLALTTFNDSSGPALFAGGSFTNAFDSGDSYLAKWGCAFVKTGTVYCSAGTTSHGCMPSISASGSASASASSGFTLSVTNVEGQRAGIFFYGIHGQLASPWSANSTSVLCVKSPLQRMSALNSGGTPGQCDGVLSEDWNAYRAAHATALGQPFLRGETVWAQGWFRDPPGLKTTKLSNGLVFAVGP
jgi:hypothetical protein